MKTKLSILFSLIVFVGYNQTTTVTVPASFSTTGQNMWTDGAAWDLNKEITLFELNWNSPYSTTQIADFSSYGVDLSDYGLGNYTFGKYGFGVDGGTAGTIGATFYTRDWDGGSVDVDYPVDVNYTFPTNFNRGETITINTDYSVDQTNALLNTNYPQVGRIGMELYFNFEFWLEMELCFHSCFSFDAIPYFNVGTTIPIFEVSTNGLDYASPNCLPSSFTCNYGGGLPVILSDVVPEVSDYGFDGYFGLPNVVTTSTYDNTTECLKAEGTSPYAGLSLEIFDFIEGLKIPYVSAALGALSGGECFEVGGVEFACYDYTLFSASFQVDQLNTQEFEFCGDVFSTLHFPTPLTYTVTDPNAGGAIVQGPVQADSVFFEVGHDINVDYPCNYEFIEVDQEHELENDFSNHTYDQLVFSFVMEAMAFNLEIEGFSFSGLTWDPPCLLYSLSCSGPWYEFNCSWNCVWDPPLTTFIPAFGFDPPDLSIGPLWSDSIPLGSISNIEWRNDSWELGGFDKEPGNPFTLTPLFYEANTTASTNVSCFGGNDGTMEVTVTNGTPPFTYNWPDGTSTTSALNVASHSGLPAGNNYVVIEDANGCQSFAEKLIASPDEELNLSDFTLINIDCNGNSNGVINVTVQGGTSPYTYSWTGSTSTNNVATGLSSGTYTLNVVDALGCSISEQFTLTEPSVLSSTVSKEDVLCNGGNSGSSTVAATGGTFPYTYLWSNGDNNQTNVGLIAGNYSVTVTDANGCITNNNTDIFEPSNALQLSSSVTDALCKNSSDGEIDLTISGGTAPYNNVWYNNGNIQLGNSTEDIFGLSSGNYNVIVTDVNGCSESLISTVDEPSDISITLNSVTDVLCYGDNTGAINIEVQGGTPGYNYNWSNGDNSEDLIGVQVGSYTIDVTDLNGCKNSESYNIFQPDSLWLRMVKQDVKCFGGSDGQIDLTVNGGAQPYSYSWSNSSINEDLNSIPVGNYNVSVQDNNGCVIADSETIIEPTAISISGAIENVSCYGGEDGEVSTTVSGGISPYNLKWSNGGSVILADTTNDIIELLSDNYTLVVTDENGCQDSQTFNVSQPSEPIIIANTKIDVSCFGGNDGSIDVGVTGGTVPYFYNWNQGNISQDISNLNAGEYNLIVTDNQNCTDSITVLLSEPNEALVVSVSSEDVLCFGDSTGSVSSLVSGGTTPYSLTWNTGETASSVFNLHAGIYSLNVIDANGCTSFGGTVINEPNSFPSFDHNIIDVSCFGGSDGAVDVTPIGGTTPYYFVFGDTLNNEFNNISNKYEIKELISGSYHVMLIDDNGCKVEGNIFVDQPDSLFVEIEPFDVSCFGGNDGYILSQVTGGTSPFNYMWSDSTTFADIADATTGYYYVIVTDDKGCRAEDNAFVDQPSELMVDPYIEHVSCRDNDDGSVEVYVYGGTSGYNYLWSTSDITDGIYNLTPGTYSITVNDANGCVKQDTFIVNALDIDCLQPPTAFTPDGDGINDTWYLPNLELYPNTKVQIFNQWGNLIYETNGTYIPWDGGYKGRILPAATYYYIIDLGNGSAPYTGPVTTVIK